jgi:hypothetical protein
MLAQMVHIRVLVTHSLRLNSIQGPFKINCRSISTMQSGKNRHAGVFAELYTMTFVVSQSGVLGAVVDN